MLITLNTENVAEVATIAVHAMDNARRNGANREQAIVVALSQKLCVNNLLKGTEVARIQEVSRIIVERVDAARRNCQNREKAAEQPLLGEFGLLVA